MFLLACGVIYTVVSLLFCFDFMMPPHAATPARIHTAEVGRFITSYVWRSSQAVRSFIALFLTCVSVVAFTLGFGFKIWNEDMVLIETIAVTLFACGYLLRVWCKQTLGKHFTYEIQRPDALINNGPYALLLHPSYTGFALEWGCLISFWLHYIQFQHAIIILGLVYVFSISFLWHWRAKGEETVMKNAFGLRWETHIKSRWRFIPFIF